MLFQCFLNTSRVACARAESLSVLSLCSLSLSLLSLSLSLLSLSLSHLLFLPRCALLLPPRHRAAFRCVFTRHRRPAESGWLVIDSNPLTEPYKLRFQLRRLPGPVAIIFGDQAADCFSCVGFALIAALRFVRGEMLVATHQLSKKSVSGGREGGRGGQPRRGVFAVSLERRSPPPSSRPFR